MSFESGSEVDRLLGGASSRGRHPVDADDPRRVWSCCKANNCEMPAPTAWTCEDAGFVAVPDFDWEEWRGGNAKPAGRPPKVTEAHIREAFAGLIFAT